MRAAAPDEWHEERPVNKAGTHIFAVLAAFMTRSEPMGVTALSQRLGMTKNMAHRALITLSEEGYLVRHGDDTSYLLGPRILELDNRSFPPPDFRSISVPMLHRLHRLTEETVQLSVRSRDMQTVIDGVQGQGLFVVRPKLGRASPLHASAASRAILAALQDEEIASYIARNSPLESFTQTTIVDPKKLWEEVRAVRARGYALGSGDYNRGTNSVSFAVMGADARPHGAITIGGPIRRFTAERRDELLPSMIAIVRELRAVAVLYDAD